MLPEPFLDFLLLPQILLFDPLVPQSLIPGNPRNPSSHIPRKPQGRLTGRSCPCLWQIPELLWSFSLDFEIFPNRFWLRHPLGRENHPRKMQLPGIFNFFFKLSPASLGLFLLQREENSSKMVLKCTQKTGIRERSWNLGNFNLNSLSWSKDYWKSLGQDPWESLGWILWKIPHPEGGQALEKLPRDWAGPWGIQSPRKFWKTLLYIWSFCVQWGAKSWAG